MEEPIKEGAALGGPVGTTNPDGTLETKHAVITPDGEKLLGEKDHLCYGCDYRRFDIQHDIDNNYSYRRESCRKGHYWWIRATTMEKIYWCKDFKTAITNDKLHNK